MFSKSDNMSISLRMVALSCLAAASLVACAKMICAQPTAAVNLFPTANKLDEGKPTKDPVEQSFHQFINSKPTESTIIGEIKPNASALELMLLRNKIANTIISMQEMDKQQQQTSMGQDSSLHAVSSSSSLSDHSVSGAECYIEVTRVEKVPGKCHRASSGLPICQSENYMTISSECS